MYLLNNIKLQQINNKIDYNINCNDIFVFLCTCLHNGSMRSRDGACEDIWSSFIFGTLLSHAIYIHSFVLH